MARADLAGFRRTAGPCRTVELRLCVHLPYRHRSAPQAIRSSYCGLCRSESADANGTNFAILDRSGQNFRVSTPGRAPKRVLFVPFATSGFTSCVANCRAAGAGVCCTPTEVLRRATVALLVRSSAAHQQSPCGTFLRVPIQVFVALSA